MRSVTHHQISHLQVNPSWGIYANFEKFPAVCKKNQIFSIFCIKRLCISINRFINTSIAVRKIFFNCHDDTSFSHQQIVFNNAFNLSFFCDSIKRLDVSNSTISFRLHAHNDNALKCETKIEKSLENFRFRKLEAIYSDVLMSNENRRNYQRLAFVASRSSPHLFVFAPNWLWLFPHKLNWTTRSISFQSWSILMSIGYLSFS